MKRPSELGRVSLVAAVVLTLLGVGCGESPPGEVRGVNVAIAALELPGIGNACYDLRLTNGAAGSGQVVWARGAPGLNGGTGDTGAICADTFGAGGEVSYVGPCDASGELDGTPGGERINSLTVWFDGLYDEDDGYLVPDGPDGWRDPCPNGCTLDVLCEENADARATFDFTVMRNAKQGFFDVAVSFEDIFCSAKLDTCYEGDKKMELLFGADGERDWTAVFGFACSAGADAANTTLHYGDLAVVCGSGPTAVAFPINPVGVPGNNDVTAGDRTLRYGVYRGTEDLTCDVVGTVEVERCQKVYWNIAISLDDLAGLGTCSLAFGATATDGGGGFAAGLPVGAGVTYPYIEVGATLAPATCQRHALDDGGVVRTVYRGTLGGVGAPPVMCSSYDGGVAGPVVGADCSDGCPNDPDKTLPGLCGCGVSDADADSDGSPDCIDACDADPTKVVVGDCGCDVSDIDGDEDGTADCLDACPSDPFKVVSGVCGCGFVDDDTDSDGTADCFDECAGDPLKVVPGVCGCGTADIDGDFDGTFDCQDACPGDPLKIAVGVCGCGVVDLDSDGDETLDCQDGCLSDPLKVEPGICGCGTSDADGDEDGTADCDDGCPGDPFKVVAGVCGCGVDDTDSDLDGTADCFDACADDPLKVLAGACGCGVSDVDTDLDDAADCVDACDFDLLKVVPGVCGCGVVDVDGDNDGTFDCQDNCPADPLKVSAGVCGCGVADVDGDNDGTLDCQDGCPADPLKIADGVCGCGVADVDGDNDGSLDCQDGCPADPLKTAAGVCGCGVADVDGDNDGTLDCQDNCPGDPLKIAAGVCGCGVADVDGDNDGTLDCQDGCPLDPLKIAAGVCGCGVSDTAGDRLGGTSANAAGSCVAILDAGDACGDTTYWIDTTGGDTSDAFQAYCDMTTDGGGWMKVESASYPFWFTDANWNSHNAATPLANNYSVLDKRQSLADVGGCYDLRLQVGDAGNWTSAQSHETIWRQCHDPFTASTNGFDYIYMSGEVSTTCGGFNGLHHKYIGSSYTSDPDLNDEINCWWMQIVPKVQYRTPAEFPGYLEGYGGAGNFHTWQSFWIRSAGLGKARGEPGLTCDALRQAGLDEDGTYWIDPNGGSNSDAFLAYCDMTETVGWTRLQGAQYPFFFNGANWTSLAIDTPLATNFSMLTRRALFASGGCTTWRVQVADTGTWQSTAEFETVWRQCHDPFTQSTNGSGYTFISGTTPTTCGGFNGLHNAVQSFMFTTDADSTDLAGCWGMQMVPNTQYPAHPGYYDGYPEAGAVHQWQTMWVK